MGIALQRRWRTKLTQDPDSNRTLRTVQEIIERETKAPLSVAARHELAAALGVPRAAECGSATFTAKDVTVLLADLRGFTSFSERYSAAVVLELLNEFLMRMSEVVARHGGRIEKFMGDSVMAVFGLPEARPDDAKRAVACALQMQAALNELNNRSGRPPGPQLFMGIGISSGWAMTGQLGSELYSEHAVIGDDVNLASRIEAVSLRGQVLISDNTYSRCADELITAEPVSVYVKGKTMPVTIHEVLEMPALGLKARRHDMRSSPRVKAKLPITYHIVRDKVVTSEARDGMLMDISYHGAALRLEGEHSPHTEIKLSIGMPFIGAEATDIYARVIRTRMEDGHPVSGVEFTVLSDEASAYIHQFVDYLLQTDPELKKP
ncbi:MAG: adenylate/guanylate cyclase domain-containing protein [Rhodospirillaceae bacterium]